MNGTPYIPAKTLENLASEHPEGTRHHAKILIAMPMLGNGLPPSAVVETLRIKFPVASLTEIQGVVRWCHEKNPQPSGNGKNGHSFQMPVRLARVEDKPEPANPEQIVSGETVDESDWRERSIIPLPEDFKDDARTLLETLYSPEDRVNMVCKYEIGADKKAKPKGGGKILSRVEWVRWIEEKGAPFSDIGCWIRPNPCAEVGTGDDGAVKDSDIVTFRFVMVESDTLPLDMQLSLYAKMALPIAAIISSGKKSAHAWLKIDAKDLDEYRAIVKTIYDRIEPLGFDPMNKNASRLSRLPGVPRKIGGPGNQRLLYLNPSPAQYDPVAFEESITPVIGLIRGSDMVERMREFFRPKPPVFTLDFMRGKTPLDGFYFRDSEVTIWSGISGHGKSTMLATVMASLIVESIPFFVASLEIKPEKLCELMTMLCNCEAPDEAHCVEFVQRFGHLFVFADIVGSITQDDLFKKMKAAHRRCGAKHFFIDSLMRVEGLEENYPQQGIFATNLQRFSKETGGHIHLVAHPKKIDENFRAKKMDVKGSSMLVNNCDNVVTMRRNTEKKGLLDEDPESEKAKLLHDAEFAVEKQRETGWEGVIKLNYCRLTKTYEPFTPLKKEFRANPHSKHYKES